MKIQIVKNTINELPKYETKDSAGMDLKADIVSVNSKFLFHSYVSEDQNGLFIKINPGGRVLIPTGLKIALPEGYEAQVRPRSGLALKYGITVLNTPGTIDADYRGDIGIILINHGMEPFKVYQGDRIAQLVINKIKQVKFEVVDDLDNTVRGSGGFGSTNVH